MKFPPATARSSLALLACMLAASAAPSPPPDARLSTLDGPPQPTLLPPSPVALFRQLLSTNAQGRAQALNARAEPQRRTLVAKLREYAELPEHEREQRLRATEFRWYFR